MSSFIKRLPIFSVVGAILAAACIVAVIIGLLTHRINKSVYSERQEMLSLVTSTAATIVDQNSDLEWEHHHFLCEMVQSAIRKESSLEVAIEKINERYRFGDQYYYLVDDTGKFYSSDGMYGRLTDLSHFTSDSPEEEEYLAAVPHLSDQQAYLTFKKKFTSPKVVNTSNGPTRLIAFCYAHSMEGVQEAVSSLLPVNTNTFIYDPQGAMMYKQFGIRLVLDGFNVLTKFYSCKYEFGENPDDLIQACKDRKPLVVQLTIGHEKFYFCSSPLNISDLSLAFLIEESSLSKASSHSFSLIILYISLIALILGAMLLFTLYSIMKRKADEEKVRKSEELAFAMSEASRAKSEFLSNMSHDIRTPINAIMGITTIAQGSVEDPAKISDCLTKIDGASHHLLSLVNDVLDMSRIESGKTKINPSPTDINIICDNVCSIIRGQMVGRDLYFKTDTEVEHSRILADELRLRQIFINILGNSVKFTRDGGTIYFRCQETASTAGTVTYRFEISDSGIGMSPEFLGRIFEPFSQEENRERTQYQGTGLGMAITKQLVDLMGGTIEVRSKIDEGSTFIVTIEFSRDLAQHSDEAAKSASANIDGIKILLVEDNALNTEIAVELLGGNGATVDTASDGIEAVDKFRSNIPGTYDVILMDIMMPNMNGLDATRAIRAMDREDARQIPIIAMTANSFDEDVKATHDAGMNAHLSKPIDIKEVVATISSFCHK